ncbi:MAG TPA: hypothetical protein PKA60_01085 [Candidatus Paceibacterota bacterium]|nr:hypothetical protein [Candidatus Paceibacterota bacterium]
MDETNKKIIIERFNSLPVQIQDAITKSGWEKKIRAIAEKNDLVVGDAYTLETTTLLVMLGIISPNEYSDRIKEELKLSQEKLGSIISDVEDQIFRDIKNRLIEFTEQEELEELEKKSEQQPIAIKREDSIEELKLKKPVDATSETVQIDSSKNSDKLRNLQPSTPKIDPYREGLM